ncbi:MAG: signal peptidase I [Solirubrobacteraceae bacterium]
MRTRPRSPLNSLIELIVIVAVALVLAFLIQAFIVKPYNIPSASMEPTLTIGQRVLVDRIGMDFGNPSVGDIVVFHPPVGAEQMECAGVAQPPHIVEAGGAACDEARRKEASVNFIKRIVAGPGDWLYVKGGHAYVSTTGRRGPFKREHDPYIRRCGNNAECNFPTPIEIAAGHWFMMGDNRGESDDSRFWGPIPTRWIIGVAFATYWPLNRIGFL